MILYTAFRVCPVCIHAHSAGISSWVWNDSHLKEILHQLSWSPSMQHTSSFISESFFVFVLSISSSLPAKIQVLARANCLRTTVSQWVSPVVFDCLQLITSHPREKLASTPTPCGMIEKMSCAPFERSAYCECVSSCWHLQLVVSCIQSIQLISIGSEW